MDKFMIVEHGQVPDRGTMAIGLRIWNRADPIFVLDQEVKLDD
jgi:hypothetical protein